MKIKINQSPDGTTTINARTHPQDLVQAKKQALQEFAPQVSLPGFRPGKAPLHLVENKIRLERLIEETMSYLSGMIYERALQEYQLEPLIRPVVRLPQYSQRVSQESTLTDLLAQDWSSILDQGIELEVVIYTSPKIELGDWQKLIQRVPSESVARQKAKQPSPAADQKEELEERILNVLVDKIEFQLAAEVVDHEVQHLLFHQTQALQKLGIRYFNYLKAQNKKAEDAQAELKTQAEKNLRRRLILVQIAKEMGKYNDQTSLNDIVEELKRIARLGE